MFYRKEKSEPDEATTKRAVGMVCFALQHSIPDRCRYYRVEPQDAGAAVGADRADHPKRETHVLP